MNESPAVVHALLAQILSDRAEGRARSQSEYQALFPGHAELVARELARASSSGGAGSGAADSEAAPLDRVGAAIGPYRLLKELGRGGQGAVFLAEDTRLHRSVALKLLPTWSSSSPLARERFRREAMVASRLEHPAICTVYEAGEARGLPYVAMRYVEGETLARRISAGRGGPPIDRREVLARCALIEEAARALHAAHEAGVLHRDVKPGNLMVTPEGRAVVLDFGLARDLDDGEASLTATGDLHGTPAYMSPERLSSDRGQVDRRTDVFSLGVTLYEFLCAVRPFDAPTQEGLFRAVLSLEPPRLRSLVPAAPRDLEVVIETALAKERGRRYSTAEAFADDLRAVRASRPISARRPSVAARALHWARREPAQATLAGGLSLALLTAAGLSGYLFAKAPALAEGRKELRRQELDRAMLSAFGAYQRPPDHEELARAVANDPDMELARIALAVSHYEVGHVEETLAACAGAASPDGAAALRRVRVSTLRRAGREAEAAEVERELSTPVGPLEHFTLAKLVCLDFKDRDARADEVELAARHLRSAILLSERPELVFHYQLVAVLTQGEDTDETTDCAKALAARWPESAIAQFIAGTALLRVRERDAGRAALERAVELEPELPFAWLSLMIFHLGAKELEPATACYRRAVDSSDPSIEPWRFPSIYGQSLYRGGFHAEAIEPLAEAVALNPELVQDTKFLVNALLEADRLPEAIGPLRGMLGVEPESAQASSTLTMALLQQGDLEGAIAECERRVGLVPDDAATWADLAQLHARVGDAEGAVRAAGSGLEACDRTAQCDEATLAALNGVIERGGAPEPEETDDESGG